MPSPQWKTIPIRVNPRGKTVGVQFRYPLTQEEWNTFVIKLAELYPQMVGEPVDDPGTATGLPRSAYTVGEAMSPVSARPVTSGTPLMSKLGDLYPMQIRGRTGGRSRYRYRPLPRSAYTWTKP